MDNEEVRQRQMKEKLMVAQTNLAQGMIAKMQGVAQRSGTNAGVLAGGRG